MYRLRKYDPFPPGEFRYAQNVNGKVVSWEGDGLSIIQQASRIVKFRQANGVARASLGEVIDDISVFTCQRLGNSEKWCVDGDAVPAPALVKSGRGCCGAKL